MGKNPTIKRSDIAIIGIGCIAPHANRAAECWRDILAGRDHISDIPNTHWLIDDYYDADPEAEDKVYCQRGSFIEPTPFDALQFGMPPANIEATDTTQLLALIATKEVLQDAYQGEYKNVDLKRASVILGVTSAQELLISMASRIQRPIIERTLRKFGMSDEQVNAVSSALSKQYVKWQENTFPGLLGNVVSGRIANRFNFGGMNCVTDAACASSFSAMALAIDELTLGKADLVVTGGADTLNDIFMYMCFAKTKALSFSGECRPFDEKADGTLLGEAITLFALKRLDDAEKNGDKIYAVIKGIGYSSDGRAKSIYAPAADGQARAIENAYKEAGYSPSTVQLIEAHGTGTKAGDLEEFKGLNLVFTDEQKGYNWCALGSIKSQLGHTKAAAGAIGLFKAVMGVAHKTYPPTLHIDKPNSQLNIENSPFYLNVKTRPWIKSNKDEPRRAGVSSFGFGGTNFHITIEEYTGPTEYQHGRLRTFKEEVLPISGDSKADVINKLNKIIDGNDERFINNIKAHQLSMNASMPYRCVILVNETNFIDVIKDAIQLIENTTDTTFFDDSKGIYYSSEKADHKIGFLFPPQGGQSLYMGDQLAIHFDEARKAWDQVADIEFEPGTFLHDVVFPPGIYNESLEQKANERLNHPAWTQAAIAIHAASQYQLLASFDIKPSYVIGHSFGQFIALMASGVYDVRTLAELSYARGKLIEEYADSSSCMLSIPGPIEKTKSIIQATEYTNKITIANENSNKQIVVSGKTDDIEKLKALLEDNELQPILLNVSHGFHSKHLDPVVPHFKKYIETLSLSEAKLKIYLNDSASDFPSNKNEIVTALAEHMVKPVHFREQLTKLYKDGVNLLIEFGNKPILTTFVKDTLGAEVTTLSFNHPGDDSVTAYWRLIAKLSALGLPVNYQTHWANYPDTSIPLNENYSKNTVDISGINANKPYPPGKFDQIDHANTESTKTEKSLDIEETIHELYTKLQSEIDANEKMLMDLIQNPSAAVIKDKTSSEKQKPKKEFSLPPRSSLIASTERIEVKEKSAQYCSNISNDSVSNDSVSNVSISNCSASNDSVINDSVSNPTSEIKTPAKQESNINPIEHLIKVVAEKTGFDVDMIKPEMQLESDLGVDSIKRVEILASMRKTIPGLENIDSNKMASLSTINEVSEYLISKLGTPAADSTSNASNTDSITDDIKSILISIIADKTGFDADMIKLNMSLEADLGVDSIKRVEIMASLKKAIPDLPAVDNDTLVKLNMIEEVIDYLDSLKKKPKKRQDNVNPDWHHIITKKSYINTEIGEAITSRDLSDVTISSTNSSTMIDALITKLKSKSIKASYTNQATTDPDEYIYINNLTTPTSFQAAMNYNLHAFEWIKELASKALSTGVNITIINLNSSNKSKPPFFEAYSSGLASLVKTAQLEWPKSTCKYIDIATESNDDNTIAELILKELLSVDDEKCYQVNSGNYYHLALTPSTYKSQMNTHLKKDDVIVVTGGARGITAACIIELAKQLPLTFVIISRTPSMSLGKELLACKCLNEIKSHLINEYKKTKTEFTPKQINVESQQIYANIQIHETLNTLQSLGSTVEYISADIRDPEIAKNIIKQIQSTYHSIDGIIHGAGLIADKHISDKTVSDFINVVETKLAIIFNLLGNIDITKLKLLTFFSSIASYYGNIGQCDYALANESLNQLAADLHKQYPNMYVKSINWSAWDSGMVTESLKKYFESKGVELLPTNIGTKLFCDEICYGEQEAPIVLLGPVQQLTKQAPSKIINKQLQINLDKQAYLQSHRIDGRIVIPIAWLLSNITELLADHLPQNTVTISNFNVNKAVTLDQPHTTLNVQAEPSQIQNQIKISVYDGNHQLCYRCIFDISGNHKAPTSVNLPTLQAKNTSINELYKHRLFHGTDMQFITQVQHIDQASCSATVLNEANFTWHTSSKLIDIALIDAILQVGILWGWEVIHKPTLPLAFDRLTVLLPPELESKTYSVVLEPRTYDSLSIEYNAYVVNQNNQIAIMIEGVKMFTFNKATYNG